MAESTSKLREQIAALTNVTGQGGFDIMEDENTFKSTYDIILGIGKVWEQMSDIDQAALLELLAGKRQGNALAATLTNLEDMQKALEVSENSAGSAMREHEKWLDSIDAKTQQFHASFESLSATVFSTDFIKGVVDAGTGFVQGIDNMIQGVQKIPVITPAIKALTATLAVPLAANAIGSFLFAPRGEEQISRLTNLGRSAKATKSRISSLLREGGTLKGKYRRAGAVFDGAEVFTNAGDLKLAATAINPYTAAILGLVAAFAALYAGKKTYDDYVEKRRDRAVNEYEEYSKNAQSMEEYKNRVKELREEIDKGGLSSDEEFAKRAELAQIQRELVDIYGSQAAALDLVNGKLSEQLALMSQMTEQEYKNWKATNAEGIERANKAMTSGWTKVSNMDVKESLRGNKQYLDAYDKLVSEIQKRVGSDVADQFRGNALNDFGLNLSDMNAYDALNTFSDLSEIIQEIGQEAFGTDWEKYFGGLYDGATEGAAATQKIIDENETLFNQYAQGELQNNTAYKNVYSGYLAAQQEFYDAYESGDREGMKKAADKRNEYMQELSKINDPAVQQYLQNEFDKFDDQFGDISVELDVEAKLKADKAGTDALISKLKSDLGGNLDLGAVGSVGMTYGVEFNENSANLTGQQQAFLDIKAAADEANVSVGAYMQALANVAGIELSDDFISNLNEMDKYLDGIEEQKDVKISAEVETSGEEKLSDIEAKQKAVEGVHSSEFKVKVNGDGKLEVTKKNIEKIPLKKDIKFEAKDKISSIAKKVVKETEKVPKKKSTKFEGEDNSSKVSEKVTKAAGLVPRAVNTVLRATDAASSIIKKVNSAIATVKRNIDIWIKIHAPGAGENWTGTTHATEGLSLVGERGEELVQSKGKAYFVGTKHPEIVWLKQGDIVYNAEETKLIKNGSKVIRSNTMNAFADGTNNTGRLTSSYVAPRTRESFHFLPANGEQGDNFKLEEQLKDALDAIDKKVKESLNNYEHQILIMEKNNVNSSELIKVYRDMQAEAARIANDYRAKGLNDNSDYIQELQKQWYEYADKIKELTVQQYEDVRKMSENAIDLNANWLNDAVTNKDYSKVLQYTQNIVQNYKYMQEQIHEEAEYYRSLGYTETSDEVSELSKLWYEYRDKILEATSQAYAGMVEAAGEAVDNMQSLYSTLVEAGEEYAESGHITIDTFQDLVGLGTKYLAFLIDENGMLVINEESIKRVLAAKTKELAVDEALNYVAQIRAAIESGNIDQINALCDATGNLTNASWGLVYAQLSQLNLSEDQYRNALININRLRSLSENAINNIDHELEQMKGDVGDILEYVKEMVKQEVENHIEALEQQIKDYNEIVDLQKESLKLQKEKDEYTKSVAKQTKDIAELQARITQLDLDDSREAQAQKLKLQEELAEKQEKLSDDQSDHSYDATVTALDKMAEAYEKQKNKEIKILENTISSEEKIYQMALKRIDTGWDRLYDDLIHWNTEYGIHLNEEITAAWKEALKMAEKYGDYLTFLNVKKSLNANGETIYDTSDKKRKDIVGKSYDDSEIRKRTTEMKKNSDEWIRLDKMKTKTPWSNKAKKDELAARNADLAKELEELIGEKLERGTNGVWYIGSVNNGAELYKVYPVYTNHSGGVVAGEKLLPDEAYAKLLKGEVVLNKEQQESVYRRLDALDTLYSKFGNLLGTTGFVNNMNHALYSADDLANIRGAMTDNSVTTLNTTVNVSVGGSIDDEAMARKYGERIGNETIKTINDAFYKRGLNLSGNVLLKQ